MKQFFSRNCNIIHGSEMLRACMIIWKYSTAFTLTCSTRVCVNTQSGVIFICNYRKSAWIGSFQYTWYKKSIVYHVLLTKRFLNVSRLWIYQVCSNVWWLTSPISTVKLNFSGPYLGTMRLAKDHWLVLFKSKRLNRTSSSTLFRRN